MNGRVEWFEIPIHVSLDDLGMFLSDGGLSFDIQGRWLGVEVKTQEQVDTIREYLDPQNW